MLHFDLTNFYRKWFRDIRDTQEKDGSMPLAGAPGWPRDTFIWKVGYHMTLRNAYLYTGDKELVKENYPALQKYEAYLHSILVNGLLAYDFYNDWLALEFANNLMIANSFLADFYEALVLFADVMGDVQGKELYEIRLAALKESINREYYGKCMDNPLGTGYYGTCDTLAVAQMCIRDSCNTLLLLIFGICMLGISTKILIDKVEDSSEMITEQAVYTLDKTFNDIAAQMVSFSSHRDLWSKFSKSDMSIQDKLDVDRELNNILKKTDLFNSVVQDIFVISDNGYYFTTGGKDGLVADYDYCSQDWYQKAKDTTRNIYVRILGLHDQDFYSYKWASTAKNKTFSISFALENSKGKVIGALIYNFDLPQLAEILCASNYEENGKVAILNEDGIIMSRSDNSGTGSVLNMPDKEHEIMKNEKTGRFWTKIDGKEYFVSFQTTSMGLKLVSYIPQSEIFRHTRSMIWLLVLIIFCSLTLNLLITFKVSGSIKRPIQKLMDNIQNVNSHKLTLETV